MHVFANIWRLCSVHASSNQGFNPLGMTRIAKGVRAGKGSLQLENIVIHASLNANIKVVHSRARAISFQPVHFSFSFHRRPSCKKKHFRSCFRQLTGSLINQHTTRTCRVYVGHVCIQAPGSEKKGLIERRVMFSFAFFPRVILFSARPLFLVVSVCFSTFSTLLSKARHESVKRANWTASSKVQVG